MPPDHKFLSGYEQSLEIYPNPNKSDMLNIRFSTNSSSKLTATISDIVGRQLLEPQEFMASEGENIFEFNLRELKAKGIYLVTLTDGFQSVTLKLTKP